MRPSRPRKLTIPERLRARAMTHPAGEAWLEALPSLVDRLARRWLFVRIVLGPVGEDEHWSAIAGSLIERGVG